MDLYSLPVHPAAAIFPLMSGAELDELAEDVKENGLRHPVVLLEVGNAYSILDGRNRMQACRIAGIDPTYTVWDGDDPIAFVASANLRRRHLSDTQRAFFSLDLERLYAAEAAHRVGGRPKQHKIPDEKPPADLPEVSRAERESRARAAEHADVSPRLISNAKRVETHAAPEVAAAARAGKVTVDDALRIIEQPFEKQAELVASVEAGEARTLREALAKALGAERSGEAAPAHTKPTKLDIAKEHVLKLSRKQQVDLHRWLGQQLETAA